MYECYNIQHHKICRNKWSFCTMLIIGIYRFSYIKSKIFARLDLYTPAVIFRSIIWAYMRTPHIQINEIGYNMISGWINSKPNICTCHPEFDTLSKAHVSCYVADIPILNGEF